MTEEPIPQGDGWKKNDQAPVSPARLIVTPIIVLVVGYLVGGGIGLAIGAVLAIVYVLIAIRR